MAQGFTSNYPPAGGIAVSATERGNWAAVVSSHAGATIPSYAVVGTPFFDTGLNHLCVVKGYGSKAFAEYDMGPTIRLGVALAGSGQTGTSFNALVRVRTGTIMSGADKHWTLSGSNINLDFNHDYDPAYFAAKTWQDTNFGEPVLWTADAKLLGKKWDTIPVGYNDLTYSGSPSVFSNVAPFAAGSLRAVDVESKHVALDASTPPATVLDHIVLALPWAWWQIQDGLVEFDLIEGGVHRPAATFKAVPFMWSGSLFVVLYNRNPDTQTLLPFDPTRPRTLTVTRKV